MNHHDKLPRGWVWTRRAFGQDFCLYACRDSRWAPTVPDLVGVGEARTIADAFEQVTTD